MLLFSEVVDDTVDGGNIGIDTSGDGTQTQALLVEAQNGSLNQGQDGGGSDGRVFDNWGFFDNWLGSVFTLAGIASAAGVTTVKLRLDDGLDVEGTIIVFD